MAFMALAFLVKPIGRKIGLIAPPVDLDDLMVDPKLDGSDLEDQRKANPQSIAELKHKLIYQQTESKDDCMSLEKPFRWNIFDAMNDHDTFGNPIYLSGVPKLTNVYTSCS